MTRRFVWAFVFFAACCGSATAADDAAYYDVRLADLTLTEGKFDGSVADSRFHRWPLTQFLHPRVAVDGEAEAYWASPNNVDFFWAEGLDRWGSVYVRVAGAARDLTGRIDYPFRDKPGFATVKFKIPAASARPDAREAFLRGKQQHYERLARSGVPGTAWFRHQAREAELELKGIVTTTPDDNRPQFNRFAPARDFDDTFSLVTGNRAVSENLQLDRLLQITQTNDDRVKLGTIAGITTNEIDWKPLLEGKSPRLDPTAAYVPADQHAVFFPTFAAAIRTADEADKQGTTLLQAAEPRSQDAGTVARYQRQIGLKTTALGRMLGPQVIRSLALTGGDPYFRVGTDVALVFEAVDVPTLRTALGGQIVLNSTGEKELKHESDELLGVPYESWRTPDRAVCSYLAAYGDVVVVTNSPAQLRRLLETHQAKTPAIASLDEYNFFRDRYPLGDAAETAFLFLSDATIRRWCGPQWRIADSRRTRDLAVLAELQAEHLVQLAAKTVEPGLIRTDLPFSTSGDVHLTAAGVASNSIGSLNFMTPISEQPLELVTKAEATAYERWRDGYQRNFSWAFDPIGLRFTIDDDRIAADLTVMPLIDNSSYNELIAVSKGKKLRADSGDPHGALLHGVLAIDKDSAPMKQASGAAAFFAPQLRVDVLGWIGESVAVYVDDDPVWARIQKIVVEGMENGDRESEIGDKVARETEWRLPVALCVEVSSAFKATAFLAGVRGFIDQAGPGMVAWETKQHGDLPYVKISPTAAAVRPGEPMDKLAVFYALTAESLTVSLSEELIQRSLDRFAARTKQRAEAGAAPVAAAASPWLGESLGFEIDEKAAQLIGGLLTTQYRSQLQLLAWNNLPILNEWHRMFPQEDPVELHERLWGIRLICPAGGKYVWNEARQTMESTVLGSPDEPKLGPAVPTQLIDFSRGRYGLTFEEHGLRARGEMLRKK